MKMFFYLAALCTLCLTSGITELSLAKPLGNNGCPANDGSATSLPGTVQLPKLLDGYTKTIRSIGCRVAGVDFAVAIPVGTSLRDPATCDCLPPFVTLDPKNRLVRVTNATSPVILSGFDYCASGGYAVAIINSPNVTITRSNFACGPTLRGVSADLNSPNLTVTYNDFSAVGSGCPVASFIVVAGGGATTVQNNRFKNSPQHVLELTRNGGTPNYRYNLIEDIATCDRAHLNYIQFQGTEYRDAIVEFNTVVQHVQAAGGEGFRFNGNPGTVLKNPIIAYNTVITVARGNCQQNGAGCALSYIIACHTGAGTGSTVGFIAHDNYIDKRGAIGAFYPGAGTYGCTGQSAGRYVNNWDMVTGQRIPGE